MFDGLKDKLGSFTEDAEEDVDVEPVEEDATENSNPEATADPDDAGASAAGSGPETPEDSGGVQAESPEAGDGRTVHAGEGTSAAGGTVRPETAETGSVEPDQAREPTAGDETSETLTGETVETAGDETSETLTGETAETAGDETSEALTGETAETAGDETSEAAGDDDGRSLTERAKLFATGKTVIDEGDLETHLEELEFALLGSDVEYEVTEEILDGVEENLLGETRGRLESTGNIVRDALGEALYDVISVGQFDFDERVATAEKPAVIVFTGVNGVGKTTTIAKLADYFERRGLSTVLANGDTFRAGANEQLGSHARSLDKKIISHEQGSDPAAVIYDAIEYAAANNVDVVLGDTAGRLHTNNGLMDQLEKIDRVIEPDMTLFVDEAVAGQDAVNRAREFDDASNIDGTVLTKADADTQGGAAISIAHVTGKPILFLGTGQDYEDIERFDPERIVDMLLGE
jgi:fused signal recognition particle receptor